MQKDIQRMAVRVLAIMGMALVSDPTQLTFASGDDSKYSDQHQSESGMKAKVTDKNLVDIL